MQSDIPSNGSLLFLIGPSGSGKSVVANALSQVQNCKMYDTDSMIEEKEGVTISKIFEREGEDQFRAFETRMIGEIAEASKLGTRCVVATGGGLPTIDGMLQRMSSLGVTLYLKASTEELWKRLSLNRKELQKRPLLFKKGRAALEAMVEQRSPLYHKADLIITTDGLSPDEIVGKVQEALFKVERVQK